MKKLSFSAQDFGMFDAELSGPEYEFFMKHTGAFKRMMQDEYGSDHKKKFVESFRQYAQEAFIRGKYSASKQFVNDAFVVSRNKHMVQFMDAQSYAKDPFFHKDTREVFRRLFGEPNEAGTCVKVICLLPLFVKFAGAMCRYLRRWLEANETTEKPAPKIKRKTKEDDEISNTSSTMCQLEQHCEREVKKPSEKKTTNVEEFVNRSKGKATMPPVFCSAHSADTEHTKQRKRESDIKEDTKDSQGKLKTAKEVENVNGKNSDSQDLGVGARNSGAVGSKGKSFNEKVVKKNLCEDKTTDTKRSTGSFVKVEISKDKEQDRMSLLTENAKDYKVYNREDIIDPLFKLTENLTPDLIVPGTKTPPPEFAGKVITRKVIIADDSCIKEMFPDLHLNELHPNQIYESFVIEDAKPTKSEIKKLHSCAFCRTKEKEQKSYKKCGKCKGKGTKFYCGRTCQRKDWPIHRSQHQL